MTPLMKRVDLFDTVAPPLRGRFRQLKDVSYGPNAEQVYDLYFPVDGNPNCPIFVFIPGGAWRRGTKEEYGFVGRRFAANGVITAVISYRLAPAAQYPDFIIDANKAVASVQELAATLNGASSRLFVGGYSAGAYNAVYMSLESSLRVCGGPAKGGISGVVSISGVFNIGLLRGAYVRDAFGELAKSADLLPINLVRPGVPPILFITGDMDRNALPQESIDLASALTRVGVYSTVKVYHRSGHKRPICAVAFPFLDNTVQDCLAFMHGIGLGCSPSTSIAHDLI